MRPICFFFSPRIFSEDYDRVDQLINDKPHVINKVTLHIRKYIADDHQIKRARHSSNDSRSKQQQRRRSSTKKTTTDDSEIDHLQNQYEQMNDQLINLDQEEVMDDRTELVNRLENNVEHLLEQIRQFQSKSKKPFVDQLFEKYTLPYVLSLTENDLDQKLEELEKESHLLRLIKQVRISIIRMAYH